MRENLWNFYSSHLLFAEKKVMTKENFINIGGINTRVIEGGWLGCEGNDEVLGRRIIKVIMKTSWKH